MVAATMNDAKTQGQPEPDPQDNNSRNAKTGKKALQAKADPTNGAVLIPEDGNTQLENDSISTDLVSIDNGKSGPNLKEPESLYDFVFHFYATNKQVSKKFKDAFKKLYDNISGDQSDKLFALARGKDQEFSKTLSLAEFVLETSGKDNQRDQVMVFVQRVASNAGSLSVTSSNAVFQQWLDDQKKHPDKLEYFFSQINKINDGKDKKGKLKKLPGKVQNNLGCIAATWLYYKNETTLEQLIAHLIKTGMDLKGEKGDLVRSRAFAFLSSMIKSTNRKKFAYFLDHVGENERKLTSSINEKDVEISQISRRLDKVNIEFKDKSNELFRLGDELKEKQEQLDIETKKAAELEEQLQHSSVHHGAERNSADIQFTTVLKELLKTLKLANTAFSRGSDKENILKYQLKEMERIINKELSEP
jgi:hypothetical protein